VAIGLLMSSLNLSRNYRSKIQTLSVFTTMKNLLTLKRDLQSYSGIIDHYFVPNTWPDTMGVRSKGFCRSPKRIKWPCSTGDLWMVKHRQNTLGTAGQRLIQLNLNCGSMISSVQMEPRI